MLEVRDPSSIPAKHDDTYFKEISTLVGNSTQVGFDQQMDVWLPLEFLFEFAETCYELDELHLYQL